MLKSRTTVVLAISAMFDALGEKKLRSNTRGFVDVRTVTEDVPRANWVRILL
jgi:hypothetical protein